MNVLFALLSYLFCAANPVVAFPSTTLELLPQCWYVLDKSCTIWRLAVREYHRIIGHHQGINGQVIVVRWSQSIHESTVHRKFPVISVQDSNVCVPFPRRRDVEAGKGKDGFSWFRDTNHGTHTLRCTVGIIFFLIVSSTRVSGGLNSTTLFVSDNGVVACRYCVKKQWEGFGYLPRQLRFRQQ